MDRGLSREEWAVPFLWGVGANMDAPIQGPVWRLDSADIDPKGVTAMADLTDELRRRRKKPRQGSRGKSRYRPVVDRGCSKKKAHKTQAEAQVVVDQIKARRVFILGLGAPSTYRCGRCGYWHLGSAALELPAIRIAKDD